MIPLQKNTFLHEHETKKALADFILSANRLSMGEKCRAFEEAFAKKQGRKEAVLFNSGSSANLAIMQALKNLGVLREGDKIGFSAITWSTSTMPIIQMTMVPVPLDCDPATLNTMCRNIEERIKTAPMQGFFLTNALGFTGNLGVIRDFCKKKNIVLIEDNCESLGTKLPSGKAGNFGIAASFSFFVAHHLSTIEGGMACTDDEELAQMLRMVRANGWDRNLTTHQQNKLRAEHHIPSEFEAKYAFYDLGYNLRPTEITGFLGLFQLQFLDDNISIRQKNHARLAQTAAANNDLISVTHDHISFLSPFAFPVIAKTQELRQKYVDIFSQAGVEIRPMIAGNIQRQPFYRKYVKESYDLPGAEFLHHHSFYCGNYPELTENDLATIATCLC